MARRALRAAAGTAALAGVLANTSCFLEGKEYIDKAVTDAMPNGAFVSEPYECQQRCKEQAETLGCKAFVWRAGPTEATNLRVAAGPGGCWLLGDPASLVDVNASLSPGRVVSGPTECGSASGTPAPAATTAAVAVAGAATTSGAAATLASGLVDGVTTAGPIAVGTTAQPAPATTHGAITDGGEPQSAAGDATEASEGGAGSSGGIPWWLIVVGSVAIVGIAAGVTFTQCTPGKAPKKKKKDKKRTRGMDLESSPVEMAAPPPAETAPLLQVGAPQAPAPAPPPEAAAGFAPPAGPMLQAGPMLPAPGAMVPGPLQAPVLQMPGLQGARQPFGYAQQPQASYAGMAFPGQPMPAGFRR